MTMNEFKRIKASLKVTKSTMDTAENTGWSVRTVQRVRHAPSLKQYREVCR